MASDELKPTTVEERASWEYLALCRNHFSGEVVTRLLADIERRDERIARLEEIQTAADDLESEMREPANWRTSPRVIDRARAALRRALEEGKE